MKLSINNTAIDIFKAYTRLGTRILVKRHTLSISIKYEITKDTKIDFRYMQADNVPHKQAINGKKYLTWQGRKQIMRKARNPLAQAK